MTNVIDIHPHIISDDRTRYPRNPLHSVQASHWTQVRPVTMEGLIAAMDRAGVAKAAIVQAATSYSRDNSYLCDSVTRYRERFTGVGFVDLLEPDAVGQIRSLMNRGVSGLRLFTATSTGEFDLDQLEDPRTLPAWELCGEAGLSMSLQAGPSCMQQVAALAKRFPKVKFILDHVARPDLSDGPPYKNASPLFSLAPLDNIYLKLTPRIMIDSRIGRATPETFFPLLAEVFSSKRLAWGSNFPASEGGYVENLEQAKACLSSLSADDREWIFGKTAQTLYPAITD